MQLIYANGACSLSVHILLEELSLPYEAIKVSLKDKTVLESYNPKSYVPALVLDTHEVLTEATSILLYLAEANDSAFLPRQKMQRTRCIEWLTFISTELHKGMALLFHKEGAKPELIHATYERLNNRLAFLEDQLSLSIYLMGDSYTIADMYALAILRIGEHVGVKLDAFPAISKYKQSLEARSLVKKVIEVEAKASEATEKRQFAHRKANLNQPSPNLH